MLKYSKRSLLFVSFLVILSVYGGIVFLDDMTPPEISLSHTSEYIAPNTSVTVIATDAKSSIKNIKITVQYNEKIIFIDEASFSDGLKTQQLTFNLGKAGITDGSFNLEVVATDSAFKFFGFSNKSVRTYPLRMDTTPPRITVKSAAPYVRRGGAGCVVYSVSKETQQTGVRVGDFFFPGFRQPGGDFLCFFAFPYFMDIKDYRPLLTAVDLAGNSQASELSVSRIHRQFKTDSLEISQSFLDSKAVEFESLVPEPMPDIKRFLVINGEVRKKNALALMETGKRTASEMLWKGGFFRMPMSAQRAGFADHRTYLWEGKKVDEQTHLGFDLASTKNAPVPAANSGKVIYTGYLGIYGNLVVIDHGLGLQSLYSHLSEIHVQTEQTVAKGDIIGKTGVTGMSGGDHLHFGMLVSGLEVTPLEWLDDHWIKDNVIDRIKATGGVVPEFSLTTPVEDKTPPSSPGKVQKKIPVRRGRR
jgi:murein DD-endopeptidase MepM/ murein hydrolase activator NlpD